MTLTTTWGFMTCTRHSPNVFYPYAISLAILHVFCIYCTDFLTYAMIFLFFSIFTESSVFLFILRYLCFVFSISNIYGNAGSLLRAHILGVSSCFLIGLPSARLARRLLNCCQYSFLFYIGESGSDYSRV